MTPHVNFFQKSQKNSEDGMGKAGKRHEMVKGTYERLACERVACKSVCVYLCMYVCMCVCVRCVATRKTCLTKREVPRLQSRMHVDVAKCHPSHTKWSGVTGNQARHQSQPSVTSATPATQNACQCHQVPLLPHKVWKFDVAKCHSCHTK